MQAELLHWLIAKRKSQLNKKNYMKKNGEQTTSIRDEKRNVYSICI